jgi:hypothetical protein
MRKLFRTFKAWLSYQLGKNPEVEKPRDDYRKFIPLPYEGVVIISADFELAWAWRFDKKNPDPLNHSLNLAKVERRNIPKLIDLSERFNIPITWGTVGHLFLEECHPVGDTRHPEIRRIPYFENEWWRFSEGDWFDHDPCSSSKDAPEWYATDLVNLIIHSRINHEIGCHSFSHISFSDKHCPSDVAESELIASQKAADPFGIRLESFIFPGHTMGNYDTIRKNGYSSMRTNFINVLGYPRRLSNGLWEHKTTMELGHNPLFSVGHNLVRFRKIIEKCMTNHQVCNLWFHPSCRDEDINRIIPSVFGLLDSNRDRIWITTMRDYTKWLNSCNLEISRTNIL